MEAPGAGDHARDGRGGAGMKPTKDPDRRQDGKFRKGNSAARTSGLWRSWASLSENERKKARRIARHIESRGFPEDVAQSLAVVWYCAGMVVDDFTALESAEERAERYPIFEQASRLMLAVLRARADKDDDGGDLADALGEIPE